LTTNFDICLPKALNEKLPHLRFVAEVWRNPADDREFDIFNRAQIVWLHGKAEQYSDRNLTEEVASLDPKLIGMLLPLLRSTPLIVVGYRGAEPSIMDCLLGDAGDLAFRKGIYWCHMKGAELHPNVEKLAQRVGGNFRLLEIGGFDELLADLDRELAGRQRALGRPVADARPDFDDRNADFQPRKSHLTSVKSTEPACFRNCKFRPYDSGRDDHRRARYRLCIDSTPVEGVACARISCPK